MRRCPEICVVLLLACSIPVCALGGPGNWEFQAGYAMRADNSVGVMSSWENDAAVLIGLTYSIRPGIQIAPRLTFRVAHFDEYNGPPLMTIPEIHHSPYRGDVLRAAEVAVGIRFVGNLYYPSQNDRHIPLLIITGDGQIHPFAFLSEKRL